MSLASLATDVPEPIERPTLAKFSAGASFVPSPVTATTSPLLLQQTHEPLLVERPRPGHDLQQPARGRAAPRRSSAANSTPVMRLRSVMRRFHRSTDRCWRAISRGRGRSVARDDLDVDSGLHATPLRRPGTSSRTGSAIAATAANRQLRLLAARLRIRSSRRFGTTPRASVRIARP